MATQGRQGRRTATAETALEHARVQELIAAFADGELSPDGTWALQEHLRDCTRCQRELTLQQDLSRALAQEPIQTASAGLRRRIEQWAPPPARRGVFRWSRHWAAPAAAAAVLICVAGAIALRGLGAGASRPIAEIPMLRDARADCRRAMARNFPRKADLQAVGEGLQFPISALDRPGIELFSTWKTTLAGSPAAGLAYRWRGIVVVQYAVPIELMRQQPGIGEALRSEGFYATSDEGEGIIAVVADRSGTVLLAHAPPEELRRLIL